MINTPFWKKARGDHVISAAMVTSILFTLIIAETIFDGYTGLWLFIWFMSSMFAGVFVPLYFVPNDWIDFEGRIPPHTFWKELLS